ncbi:lanthionine synthetase LanC family protein [candidate division KSB1 bacterium]
MFRKIVFLLFVTLCLLNLNCGTTEKKTAEGKYLSIAENAAEWVMSTAVGDETELFWPSQPDTMQRGEISLYHGVPGGILFFLEMYKATGKQEYLTNARSAANWLAGQAHSHEDSYFWSSINYNGEPVPDPGLYTGTAGAGAALLELIKYDGSYIYKLYAKGAADYLAGNMTEFPQGYGWNSSSDIVSGAAGTGLFLIRAAEELDDPEYLEAAEKAGNLLMNLAIDENSRKKWAISPGMERLYPNFSHGTAGVSFFLTVLYEATEKEEYLHTALEGAEWLLDNKGEHDAEGSAWYHHEPDGKDLFYVSWCHGPGGTARLFYQLHKVTGEQKWLDIAHEAAQWLMTCGLNEKHIDGYWNVSACCGNAGIADFFLDMYKVSGRQEYLDGAIKMADDLTEKAAPGDPGLKWIQAENRTRPEEVYAQTGWAQGSAGIGLMYLKLYAFKQAKPPFKVLALPDTPFRWDNQ